MKDFLLKVQEIKAINKELKRRKKIKIYSYNKGDLIHKKQVEFSKSQKRNRWVFGGNRSGKTECGAVETVYFARGIHPYRENKRSTTGWVVSLSTKVQKDVAQRKILDYLDPEWIDSIVMQSGSSKSPKSGVIERIVVNSVFGEKSEIIFKSVEEGREKFQGASLDYVWFDEEPPEDIYNECLMRVLDKAGDVFGTMTPLKGRTFIYDRIYLNSANDDEVFCLFMEWADNPFLSQNEIKRLSGVIGESELSQRRYGKFADKLSGHVYPEFDPAINVVEPFEIPKFWQDILSIDPGLNNPLSCHWYAVDPETRNIYVVAEHYEAGQNIDYHANKIWEISRSIGWKMNSFGGIDSLIDSASLQKVLGANKSVAELFLERKIYVNPRVNKDLFSGISKVKSALKNANGESKLFIFSNCVNLIREIKGYRWGNDDRPIKKDDHSLDELRYYISRNYSGKEPDFNKNAIQKDKDNLLRRLRCK